MTDTENTETTDFIRAQIKEDLANGRFTTVHTRFPPEPNGYLHIGHATAINADFSIAEEFGGKCNLRFDDTNPVKEDTEYVDGIMDDIRWLGFDWEDRLFYASDYFDQLYEWAVKLIKQGDAYVDDLNIDEIREYRGTLTEPGKNSPYRDRSIEENLDLFERMKNGEFPDGTRTLRAKIDMSSPVINLRDPVMYRILHEPPHHRTGNKWKIYPMYDWAHGQSDSLEGITYSLCSLEYLNHRPLYDWFLDKLGIHHTQQLEFGRVNLTYTVTSKRKLRRLVEGEHVDGWDDPRMPTIIGMRRLGYTSTAIRDFCKTVGLSRSNRFIDLSMLEYAVRNDLNSHAPRAMAVLEPLKVVITNYPDDRVEEFDLPSHPQDRSNTETYTVPFSKEIYIEQSDFMEDPPRKFFRLGPGREVRLLGAYYVTCTDFVKDADGNVVELHCTYDPESQGGNTPDGRKVKGTIHWVSAEHALNAEIRLYDRLFKEEDPDAGEDDFLNYLNPDSLAIIDNAKLAPNLADAQMGDRFQFMRQGYFTLDRDSTPEKPVFNRTITLRDTWAKMKK